MRQREGQRAEAGEPLLAELFSDSIREGGAVVDGGAEAGFHTLIAAREVGAQGRVMAFEPNPSNYRALRRNVRRSGFIERVIALPLAIGAWSARRTFQLPDAVAATDAPDAPFVPGRWSEGPPARGVSLDGAVGERAIDVVRLSAGGDEIKALRGMRRALALSPEARLFVDCDAGALARAGHSASALLEELRDLGFRANVIEEIRRELVPAGAWLDEISSRVRLMCEPASARRRLARRVRGPRRQLATVPA